DEGDGPAGAPHLGREPDVGRGAGGSGVRVHDGPLSVTRAVVVAVRRGPGRSGPGRRRAPGTSCSGSGGHFMKRGISSQVTNSASMLMHSPPTKVAALPRESTYSPAADSPNSTTNSASDTAVLLPCEVTTFSCCSSAAVVYLPWSLL